MQSWADCITDTHEFSFWKQHGKLGKSARGQRTTTALVRSTSSPISGAECDTLIDFSADLLRALLCRIVRS